MTWARVGSGYTGNINVSLESLSSPTLTIGLGDFISTIGL